MSTVGKPRVLIVDDEEAVLRVHALVLERHGYEVQTAANGIEALRAMKASSFDVIFSDIDMPGMDGLRLLEQVRSRDLDVPVILITGAPSIQSAARAMEYGALRYIVKPTDLPTLRKLADDAVRLHRIAKAKRQALDLAGGVDRLVGDGAGLTASFGRAIESLWIAYQPIVSWSNRSIFAYEALLRSDEPSLPNPEAVLDAAERLGRVHDLGRIIRARALAGFDAQSDDVLLFLNLHPTDLLDEDILSSGGLMTAAKNRVVLEITERASLHGIPDIQRRITALHERGFRIAIDDLGAGYAGLTSFALLEPSVVKIDMALVRDLHKEPTKQTLVRTIVQMCRELGITVTAEGIETVEERDELARAGCDLMQGFLFARPSGAFSAPVF